MNRRLPLAALLLSLLALLVAPAHAGTADARMDVAFVVAAACTVSAVERSAAPGVSCNDASLYGVASAAGATGGAAAWTVTF